MWEKIAAAACEFVLRSEPALPGPWNASGDVWRLKAAMRFEEN